MNPVKIHVEYENPEYSIALEKALLLSCLFVSGSKEDPECLLLNESFLPKYTPVSEVIAKIMALHCQGRPVKPQEEVQYTCFCSAIGGSGLSTASFCYAKLLSEVFGKKTGYISFDPWFRRLPASPVPGMGLTILEKWPCSEDLDELVIDLPFGCELYSEILNMSDCRVIVLGYLENRTAEGKRLYNALEKKNAYYVNPPRNILFENHFDQGLDLNDPYSQLWKEVQELAKELH